MSNQKHTKGPWEWTGDQPNDLHKHNDWLCGENEGVLCHGAPWPVSEANARLIAASPSLYEYARKKAQSGDSEAMAMLDSLGLSD